MYGKAVNEINVVQNANDIMPNFYSVKTDLNNKIQYLKPEQINTFEIGHTLVNDGEKGIFEMNTNIFLNSLDGLISRRLNETNTKAVSFNDTKRLITRGVEIMLKKSFNLKLGAHSLRIALNSGLTLQSTKTLTTPEDKKSFQAYFSSLGTIKDTNYAVYSDDESKRPISFSPPILFTFNAVCSISQTKFGNFSISFGANYVGKMFSQYDITPSVNDFLGDKYENGYWRFSSNLRLSDIKFGDMRQGGFYVNFKIANLSNKKYYYPTQSVSTWAGQGVLGRGRQIVGTIGFKF